MEDYRTMIRGAIAERVKAAAFFEDASESVLDILMKEATLMSMLLKIGGPEATRGMPLFDYLEKAVPFPGKEEHLKAALTDLVDGLMIDMSFFRGLTRGVYSAPPVFPISLVEQTGLTKAEKAAAICEALGIFFGSFCCSPEGRTKAADQLEEGVPTDLVAKIYTQTLGKPKSA